MKDNLIHKVLSTSLASLTLGTSLGISPTLLDNKVLATNVYNQKVYKSNMEKIKDFIKNHPISSSLITNSLLLTIVYQKVIKPKLESDTQQINNNNIQTLSKESKNQSENLIECKNLVDSNAQKIANTTDELNEIKQNILDIQEKLLQQITNEITNNKDEFDKKIEYLNQKQNKLQKSVNEDFASDIRSFDKLNSRYEDLAGYLAEIKDNLQKYASKDNIKELKDLISHLQSMMNSNNKDFDKSIQNLRSQQDKTQDQISKLTRKTQDQISELTHKTQNQLSELASNIERNLQNYASKDNFEQLNHQLEEISENLRGQTESTRNLKSKIDSILNYDEFISQVKKMSESDFESQFSDETLGGRSSYLNSQLKEAVNKTVAQNENNELFDNIYSTDINVQKDSLIELKNMIKTILPNGKDNKPTRKNLDKTSGENIIRHIDFMLNHINLKLEHENLEKLAQKNYNYPHISNHSVLKALDGVSIRLSFKENKIIDDEADISEKTYNEIIDSIINLEGPNLYETSDEKMDGTLLRIAISDKLWNKGNGFALGETFFLKRIDDWAWHNEKHYQKGKKGTIKKDLKKAIDNVFGNISKEESSRKLFSTYLDNSKRYQGYGSYYSRYKEIPEEDRRLFENVVYLLQPQENEDPGLKQLRETLNFYVKHARNNACANEALDMIRNIVNLVDGYFMTKNTNYNEDNAVENFDKINDKILTEFKTNALYNGIHQLPQANHGTFGSEHVRLYNFKLADLFNLNNSNDNYEYPHKDGQLVDLYTYGEVADVFAKQLSLEKISETAESTFKTMTDEQRDSFFNSIVSGIEVDFKTFSKLANVFPKDGQQSFEEKMNSIIKDKQLLAMNEDAQGDVNSATYIMPIQKVLPKVKDWIQGKSKVDYGTLKDYMFALVDNSSSPDYGKFPEFILGNLFDDNYTAKLAYVPYLLYLYSTNLITQ